MTVPTMIDTTPSAGVGGAIGGEAGGTIGGEAGGEIGAEGLFLPLLATSLFRGLLISLILAVLFLASPLASQVTPICDFSNDTAGTVSSTDEFLLAECGVTNTGITLGELTLYMDANMTLAGDVTGPPDTTVVGNDSHDHTTTTLSGILEPDLNEDSGTPTDEDVLTYDSTGTNFNWVAQSGIAAGTAAALAANGGNCAAGEIPLGVDAAGAVESCYEPAEADITDLDHTATAITDGLIVEADLDEDSGTPTDADVLTYDSTGANFNWIAQSGVAAGTAAALAANGGNCAAGEIPLGVDAAGAVESCYEPAEADISDLDHTATTITDDLVAFPDIDFSATLAGNPALLVDECYFSKTATGGCFICEGSTADTNEQLYCFQDLNGADTTAVIATEAGTQTFTNKSISGAQIDSGTVPVARVGADHIDAASEISNIIGSAEMADEDHGNVVWSSGVATVQDVQSATSNLEAADNDTTQVATTSFVQQEINGAGGTDLTCSGGTCNVDNPVTAATTAATANAGDSATAFFSGGEVEDARVVDTITASNYLPLAGGVLTGEVTVDNLGLEFTEGDDHSNCSAFSTTGGGLFYDDSDGKFKKCQDNVLTDLDTSGGFVDLDTDYGDETVTSDFDFAGGELAPPSGTAFPGSPAANDIFVVTDDSAIGACDSAAGSAVTLCRYSGAAWVKLGDGGGGTTRSDVRHSLLNHMTIPDTTGDAFFESYATRASNDFWQTGVWTFLDVATDACIYGVLGSVPDNYTDTAELTAIWTSQATSGNFDIQFDYRAVGGNDTESLDQATAQEQVSEVDVAPSATDERMVHTIALTDGNFAAGDTIEWRLCRDATSDTIADEVQIFGLYFEYDE